MKKKIPILYHEDDRKIHAHSSIDQFRNFLSVYERGGWTPIEFQEIDYIDCDKIVSHPIIVKFGFDIGYYFQDGECTLTSDEYPIFRERGIVLKELPECMGEGFYQAYEDKREIINFGSSSALGTHTVQRLRIGQDYLLAEDFLPPDDTE